MWIGDIEVVISHYSCENGRRRRANALSLLPENVLPQWQQKIALRAKNPSGHRQYNEAVEANFLRSNFLQVLDLLIFRQKQPGHWGRGCLPFSPYFVILVKMDWRHWASIARLSIRKMSCPNGSKKLLKQKIFIRPYHALDPFIFCTKCNFLQVLDLLIFRQ